MVEKIQNYPSIIGVKVHYDLVANISQIVSVRVLNEQPQRDATESKGVRRTRLTFEKVFQSRLQFGVEIVKLKTGCPGTA